MYRANVPSGPPAQQRSRPAVESGGQLVGGSPTTCNMHFSHTPKLWAAFPRLTAGVMHACGVHGAPDFDDLVRAHTQAAKRRLDGSDNASTPVPLPEGQWPEIQAWRRVYSEMGLQPTQVRCAAEALLRRLRQDGQLPKVHPLVDLCNAVSVHAAAPIAIFDCARVAWPLSVAHAQGGEEFLTFSGNALPRRRWSLSTQPAALMHASGRIASRASRR